MIRLRLADNLTNFYLEGGTVSNILETLYAI